jgi:predicted phosphodiesterase
MRKTGRKKAKIAVISCTHSPFTPEKTHEWILQELSGIPDITHFGHLGDVFEAGAASIHANEFDHSLSDEYEHAHNLLKSIREVLPKDTIRWINTGNHDDNLMCRDPRRIPKDLRGLVHWRNHPEWGEEFANWHWVPYDKSSQGVYRVGQCHFYHGFDCGMNSDELEGLQMIGACGWIPFSLTVRGHTHRPVPPTQCKRTSKIPLPFWYSNVGTCGPLKPNYMKRKDTSLWGSAMLIVDCIWDKPSRLNGRCWEAELRKMP